MNTLLEIATTAARDAGKEILALYSTTDFERKVDGSPLTIADTRSYEVLLEHLVKTGIQILSEESGTVPIPYPTQMWIIDPLDGTKDFLNKTNDFSVMVGLLENGRPTLGVVYAPALDTLYYAEKGTGAFVEKNGVTKKLRVGTRDSSNLRYIRSGNQVTKEMGAVAEELNALRNPRGSIGIKSGLLGEEFGDFFSSWGAYGEWDICAPEIIALEAGGKVTDCNGETIFYGTANHKVTQGAVFSNGACHARVIEAIQKVKATGPIL